MAGTAFIDSPDSQSPVDENSGHTFTYPDFFNLASGDPIPNATLKQNPQQEGAALIAAALLARLEEVAAIDSEDDEEMPESGDEGSLDSESEQRPSNADYNHGVSCILFITTAANSHLLLQEFGGPQKRARTTDKEATSTEWFPWKDRITCTLDILMHLPRSVFSQRQLDLFLWLLRVNGVADIPSVKTMKSLNTSLQKMCGIETLCYDGALGNRYYANSLAQIIAQEMANPHVRPKLHFYPEDSGAHLSEARQAQRWLNEAPDTLLTPMARINARDFYIHEPAMLLDGSCCIPIRWFSRGDQLHARCWRMEPLISDDDTTTGWRVVKSDFDVRASHFLKNFVELKADAGPLYGLPDPTKLLAVVDSSQCETLWTYTNSVEGNRWRKLASGHRVVSFPIWMYCDDTSGNVSKKWNEHNSILFTAAGLPRSDSSKEYNVHFLCTSNIAPPLEMLDGVIDQLEMAQEEGIWAWDCESKEPILVLPWVLALLGDNPMQSEFAGHIGLRGKYFCRVCWVKGVDARDQEVSPQDISDRNHDDDDHTRRPPSEPGIQSDSEQSQSDASASTPPATASAPRKSSKLKKKFTESSSQMLDRILSFVKPGRACNKSETTAQLRSYFDDAKTLGSKTKVKADHTSSGIKDTFQEHFLDRLFNSYSKKRTTESRQAALDQEIDSLPEEITSPVWRIKELDPHQDTPVEILHVVLLGFLKYMWRDLVNQVKNQEELKKLLETRLKSLNVDGLDISPVAGHTLVQYAGSLTGRDFRVIAQIAPFIIHDIKVSDSCREAWLAISRLVPLIWQPEINDIEDYIRTLEQEVDHFLLCVARWTSRWFNKPKFHILVHLALHIRRFGPAMLFATEVLNRSMPSSERRVCIQIGKHHPETLLWHLHKGTVFAIF
ncbi:hypothetical protein F5880DRAFT_353082 [Lentinula raphanica]|nr:hypothetical protein F5880DRAFT_353082 [Lentinula raphanica]